MAERVLFVDDEAAVVEGYARLLRNDFEIEVASSGNEALSKLDQKGPFAVVVADMRMPGMSGAQLLAKVTTKHPEVMRIMLTGDSDVQTAVKAVNEGNIFRFLTKPCDRDVLVGAINAALVQFRLASLKNKVYQDVVDSGPPKLAKPARDLALDDAAEQVRSILAKNATTRLPSTQGGIYRGKTIWIGPEHVVQRISATTAVAHPKKLLDATPQLGDAVRIEYSNGFATVEADIG